MLSRSNPELVCIRIYDYPNECSSREILLHNSGFKNAHNHPGHHKPYWDSKLCIGRSVFSTNGSQLSFHPQMSSDNTVSRRHVSLDFSRAFTTYLIPYKFRLFLYGLKKNNLYFPDVILGIIFNFFKKPKEEVLYCNRVFKRYVRVRDLGTTSGTFSRITSVALKDRQKFRLGGEILTIEKLENESKAYENHFFRGITPDYCLRVHPSYQQNVINDMEVNIEGECGYPYILCNILNIKYILIATSRKMEFTVGRDMTCDVFVDTPNVSRTQCRIIYNVDDKSWGLHDGVEGKGSLNGSFLFIKNRNKGEKSEWTILDENHEILIADFGIKINYL